jgi:hypothetical protein
MESFILTEKIFNQFMQFSEITAPYNNLDIYYLITPNEFYTNYEKLFFPFEKYARLKMFKIFNQSKNNVL